MATLYKWVDASGQVHYSDQPPNADVKTEIIGTPPPASRNAVREMANQDADFKNRQSEKADDAKKAQDAAKTRANEALRADACARLRSDIDRLENSDQNVILRVDQNGDPVNMDDEARRAESQRLRRLVADNCKS